ncbi:MAG TPA: metallophosphoesterase [Gemmatimonadales bacterium]|nr:metallophosphoesterase [Gemmatimonadales bacterium]
MATVRSVPRLAALALAVAACTRALEPATLVPAPVAPLDSIEVTLFLLGDAGSAAYDGEPVLQDLARQSDSLRPVKQFIVFLGDNVYPRGVPPAGHPMREDAEKRIAAQVLAIRKGAAQGLLIPGNHDWDRQGRDGWNSIRRQDTLVRQFGGEDVRLLPGGGCPGPEVVDLGTTLRLIALDSEWWVHNDVKPYGPDSPCPTRTEAEVADSLAGALRDKGTRHAVVLTHHPLRSGGIHGGAFTLGDHIFPLRHVESWLWIPLPLIGSIYPFARTMGISNQDISGKKYQAMRRAFEAVFAEYPPLVMASGHDHHLQVIRGGRPEVTNAGYQLVSGSGILGHASLVRKIEGSLFQREAAGFMRLDFTRDGRVRLSVTTVVARGTRKEGESAEVFSLWLTREGGL